MQYYLDIISDALFIVCSIACTIILYKIYKELKGKKYILITEKRKREAKEKAPRR
jgi:hypothetical protein